MLKFEANLCEVIAKIIQKITLVPTHMHKIEHMLVCQYDLIRLELLFSFRSRQQQVPILTPWIKIYLRKAITLSTQDRRKISLP